VRFSAVAYAEGKQRVVKIRRSEAEKAEAAGYPQQVRQPMQLLRNRQVANP